MAVNFTAFDLAAYMLP